MTPTRLTRRNMLRMLGLGGVAATLPFARPRLVHGAPDTVPKRVIFFIGGSGALPGSWEPRGVGGAAEPTETAFELGPLHAPIAAHQRDLILFENLDMWSAQLDPVPGSNAHLAGATHALTAANRHDGSLAGDVSIDQLIARSLNTPAPVTALPSIELCGTDWSNGNEDGYSYRAAAEPLPFLVRPDEVYDRLFPEPLDAGALAGAKRSAVFDFVRGEHDGLIGRLAAEDRAKVVQHLDAVSDLEARLGITSSRAALRPDPSILDPWSSVDYGYDVPPSGKDAIWQWTSELNIRLAVAALHTDTTRVATILVKDAPGYTFGYTDGDFGSDNPHDLTHEVNDERTSQSRDPSARAAIERQHLATMEKLGLLLDLLAERTETDGQRLLDHTVVVYCSQIADGSHDLQRLPWFTVGGCRGYFRTGRYLRFPRRPDPERSWRDDGRGHNDLFVSIANAMGVEIDRFGNEACTGPISEMR